MTYRLQVYSIPALLALAIGVHIAVRWEVHDLDHRCPQYLAGSSRGCILWRYVEPQLLEPVRMCQREQQPTCPNRKSASTVFGGDLVADVSCKTLDVVSAADAQVDRANLGVRTVKDHLEEVSWHESLAGIGWLLFLEYEPKFPIHKYARLKKCEVPVNHAASSSDCTLLLWYGNAKGHGMAGSLKIRQLADSFWFEAKLPVSHSSLLMHTG